MEGTRHRNPALRPFEPSSLFGLVNFRPRLVIALAFLTLTVAVVAFHFLRESEIGRVDSLVHEGIRLFAATPAANPSRASRDPAEIEGTIRALTGAKLLLPRDERLFSFQGVTEDRVGKSPAAAVRLTYDGEPCLLLVVCPGTIGLDVGREELFAGPGFVSGERDGRSFVYWERDGMMLILVSAVDLTRTFDLVRRFFT